MSLSMALRYSLPDCMVRASISKNRLAGLTGISPQRLDRIMARRSPVVSLDEAKAILVHIPYWIPIRVRNPGQRTISLDGLISVIRSKSYKARSRI